MFRSISRRKLPCDTSRKLRKMYICFSFYFFSLLHTQPAQSSQVSFPSEQQRVHRDVHTTFRTQLLPCIPVPPCARAPEQCKSLSKEGKGEVSFHSLLKKDILGLMVIGCYFSSLLEGSYLKGPEDECSAENCKKGPLRAAGAAAPKAGRALPSISSLLAGVALKHWGPWSTSASSATLDPWTTRTTCSLEKWELSLELLQMLHEDTLPFALPLILAVVDGCAEAPVFFPGCCKKSVARGRNRGDICTAPGPRAERRAWGHAEYLGCSSFSLQERLEKCCSPSATAPLPGWSPGGARGVKGSLDGILSSLA